MFSFFSEGSLFLIFLFLFLFPLSGLKAQLDGSSVEAVKPHVDTTSHDQ